MAPTVARIAEKMATCWPRPPLCPSCSTAWSCAPWTWIPCPDILRCSPLVSADVVLELLDGEILVRDDVAHDVADRDHADDAAVLHDGQVADVALRHDRHALAVLVARRDGDHVGGHYLVHARGVRGAGLQDDLAGVVALREQGPQ